MKSKLNGRFRNLITLVVMVAIIYGAYQAWSFFNRPASAASSIAGELTASGTIESRSVNVAAEIGGRVLEVGADEGEKVSAGQVLVKLDDSSLQAQYAQAKAALAAAQANHDLLAAGPTAEQIRQSEAALMIATANYSRTVAGTRQTDIDAAQAVLTAAVEAYNKVKAGPLKEDYAAAEANYRNAQAALNKAQAAYDTANMANPAGIGASPAGLALEQATNNYNAARAAYDKVAMSPDNAQISAAFQQVQNARAALERAKNPARDFDIVQAQAQVAQAQAALDALKSGARQQQLDAATAQIAQAQAAVQAIEVNLKKLTLTSPADGVIMSRAIEPGEMASPAAALLVVGKLTALELTVYIPESQFALVTPGQQANVTVDAYPDRAFKATVLRLADQAEFTPRNVSTVEGRKDTVYAIHLSIANADMALKPGMPADVTFLTQ
jgi:multidrug resistance efflux pump